MSRATMTFFIVLLGIAAVVGYLSLFTVEQTQQALVLQFGNPIRVINARAINPSSRDLPPVTILRRVRTDPR